MELRSGKGTRREGRDQSKETFRVQPPDGEGTVRCGSHVYPLLWPGQGGTGPRVGRKSLGVGCHRSPAWTTGRVPPEGRRKQEWTSPLEPINTDCQNEVSGRNGRTVPGRTFMFGYKIRIFNKSSIRLNVSVVSTGGPLHRPQPGPPRRPEPDDFGPRRRSAPYTDIRSSVRPDSSPDSLSGGDVCTDGLHFH